jgi:hypothetical protein
MWFHNETHQNLDIIQQCKIHKPSTIYINTDTEWFWGIDKEQVDELYDAGVENINIIFSSYNCEFYKNYYEPRGIPMANLIFWPTFWFNWAERLLVGNNNLYKTQTYNNFVYPFISLNNKSHNHRCAMIDMIAKYNLLDSGKVTWNKTPHPNLNYNFRYFDNGFRGLSDDFVNKLDSFLICQEQHQSFLHVIGEATTDVPFITEKTVIPILYKKPFITIADKNFSSYLRNLGFELFDEIIDYSYDSIENLEDRADAMIKNILPLLKEDYNKLYQKLLPKLEHNYNRAWQIIKDINYIPDIIQERYESVKAIGKIEGFDGRYQIFIEQTVPN